MPTIRDIARNAGFDPFTFDGSYSGSLWNAAARQLQGKTHYFDAGNRSYFGGRVHSMRNVCEGLALAVIESVQPPQGPRLYRFAAFDCTGQTIYRTETETDGFSGFRTKRAAEAERDAWCADQSSPAMLRAMLDESEKQAARTQQRVAEARAALATEVQA